MKQRVSVLSIALLAVFTLLVVPSVFADHGWIVEDIVCDPATHTVTISGSNFYDSSTDTYVYVDGVEIGFFSSDPGDGPYSFTVTDPSIVRGVEVVAENKYGADVGGPSSASTICGDDVEDNGQFFDPGDDRINRQAYAPIAIYCAETRLEILSIDGDGNGTPAIILDFASMPATPTDENLLVDTVSSVQLYRLTSGEWAATAGPDAEGKTYMLVWDGCPATYIQAYIQQNGVTTPTEVFPN